MTIDTTGFRILHDLPSEKPGLDFNRYAGALVDFLTDSHPRFAVGIFGGWGSGKTTLMKLIEAKLPANMIPVWFTAWRYEKEEHLIVPLLDVLREALVTWGEKQKPAGAKLAVQTASTVGKVITSVLAGVTVKFGLPGAAELSLDANKALARAAEISKEDRDSEIPRSFYHATFRALGTTFEKFNSRDSGRRIVVFVDDLDRCLPDAALETLESMKLFFDLEGFLFVVGLDREVVEAAIDAKYSRERGQGGTVETVSRVRGADYVKKIFQVPFSMKQVTVGEIDNFLKAVYVDAKLPQQQCTHLDRFVKPHLAYLFDGTGLNPREVKRYINAYLLVLKIRPDLDPNVYLALQTIDFQRQWQLVRTALYAYRHLFIDALMRYPNDAQALENLSPSLQGIPPTFFEYVGLGGPAAALLGVDSMLLDTYLYAGESTSSTSSGLIDLVKDAANLRSLLQAVVTAEDGQGPGSQQAALADLDSAVKRLSSKVQDSSISSTAIQVVRRGCQALEEAVRSARAEIGGKVWFENRREWLQANDVVVSRIIDRLAEIR